MWTDPGFPLSQSPLLKLDDSYVLLCTVLWNVELLSTFMESLVVRGCEDPLPECGLPPWFIDSSFGHADIRKYD